MPKSASRLWRASGGPLRKARTRPCSTSSTTTEAEHYDDHVKALRTYVYLNLWSDIDPTDMAEAIRQAMFSYGFGMLEESDKGYNHPAYDPPTKTYTVQWTWVWFEEVDYGT